MPKYAVRLEIRFKKGSQKDIKKPTYAVGASNNRKAVRKAVRTAEKEYPLGGLPRVISVKNLGRR